LEGKPGARVTAYLPDIGRVLPVYVADQYEGFDAKPFLDLMAAPEADGGYGQAWGIREQ
jgi:hypothetical protein